jgi:hypothetical protein
VNPPTPAPRSQAGAALLTVLSVLVALGVAVTLVADRMRGDIRPWAAEAERTQALYLAESGLAYQLYLERWSDSSEPSFGPPGDTAAADSGIGFGEPGSKLGRLAPTDTFQFRMDTTLGVPRVKVDRSRAFLDIRSTGRFRQTEVTLRARLGRALDDSIFGPALTLDNAMMVEPFPADRVQGLMRIRTPAPGMATLPFLANFSVVQYAATFTDRMYYEADAALRGHLGDSAKGKANGNGHFTPREPPRFGKEGYLAFPLGQVDFVNDGEETWVVKGPGRIYCDGEIRVKGNIRLDGIKLYSGKNVTFEDSVSGAETSVFARGSVFLHGRCRLGMEAVAGKDIVLRDKAQTETGSVLLSTGGKGNGAAAGDSTNAIRVVNEAVARGFLIAAGGNGRVAMAGPANRVEGVIIASAAWLAGEVDGPVLAAKLLCEGTHARNCLGPARIYRNRLPRDFIQPLKLGSADRRTLAFRLMDWKLE